MKKATTEKIHVIYSNYWWDADESGKTMFDYAREFLFETQGDENGWNSVEDIPDKEAYEYMNFEDEEIWNNFEAEFSKILESEEFLIVGRVGRWNGTFDGGMIIHCFNDLFKFWKDCDYIKAYDIKGHLYIEASHHDGHNFAELKRITDRGLEYLNSHEYDDARGTHKAIMNSNFYSGLPHYAHKIYGLRKYA